MLINGQRVSRDALTGDPAAFPAIAAAALRIGRAIRTVRGAAMASRPGTIGAAVTGRALPRAVIVGTAGGAAGAGVTAALARRVIPPGGLRTARGFAVAPGERRRRRMRVTNTKALTRALRRVEGFSRVAKRVLKISAPKARVSGFKLRRGRR